MIIGYSENERAVRYLRDNYQLTREEALDIVSKAEGMGWVPLTSAADEAAAAASNDLTFQWKQPFQVRSSVSVSIYRRLLGNHGAQRYLLTKGNPDEPVERNDET